MMIKDIAIYIDGLGYGTFQDNGFDGQGNNIFLNYYPERPNNVISIYDTGGEGKKFGYTDTKRRVQILVRNEKMYEGNFLAWAIHNALTDHLDNGYVVSNGRQMLISSVNTPVSIGKDKNNLFEYSINFDVWTTGDL